MMSLFLDLRAYRRLIQATLMDRNMKLILKIAVVMLVLFLAAYVFLNKFISPEFIKEKVSKTVSQKIHRDVLIGGNLSWSLFPRIKISIHDVKLGNPANFQGSHPFFLEVSKLDLGLDPFKLIRKKIEVNYLAVDGLSVFLFVNNKGQNSWDLSMSNEKDRKSVV